MIFHDWLYPASQNIYQIVRNNPNHDKNQYIRSETSIIHSGWFEEKSLDLESSLVDQTDSDQEKYENISECTSKSRDVKQT